MRRHARGFGSWYLSSDAVGGSTTAGPSFVGVVDVAFQREPVGCHKEGTVTAVIDTPGRWLAIGQVSLAARPSDGASRVAIRHNGSTVSQHDAASNFGYGTAGQAVAVVDARAGDTIQLLIHPIGGGTSNPTVYGGDVNTWLRLIQLED